MDLDKRIGAALQRAATELPRYYDLHVEVRQGVSLVVLYAPPIGDDDPGMRITDFCGVDIADYINNAVNLAVERNAECTESTLSPSV